MKILKHTEFILEYNKAYATDDKGLVGGIFGLMAAPFKLIGTEITDTKKKKELNELLDKAEANLAVSSIKWHYISILTQLKVLEKNKNNLNIVISSLNNAEQSLKEMFSGKTLNEGAFKIGKVAGLPRNYCNNLSQAMKYWESIKKNIEGGNIIFDLAILGVNDKLFNNIVDESVFKNIKFEVEDIIEYDNDDNKGREKTKKLKKSWRNNVLEMTKVMRRYFEPSFYPNNKNYDACNKVLEILTDLSETTLGSSDYNDDRNYTNNYGNRNDVKSNFVEYFFGEGKERINIFIEKLISFKLVQGNIEIFSFPYKNIINEQIKKISGNLDDNIPVFIFLKDIDKKNNKTKMVIYSPENEDIIFWNGRDWDIENGNLKDVFKYLDKKEYIKFNVLSKGKNYNDEEYTELKIEYKSEFKKYIEANFDKKEEESIYNDIEEGLLLLESDVIDDLRKEINLAELNLTLAEIQDKIKMISIQLTKEKDSTKQMALKRRLDKYNELLATAKSKEKTI